MNFINYDDWVEDVMEENEKKEDYRIRPRFINYNDELTTTE